MPVNTNIKVPEKVVSEQSRNITKLLSPFTEVMAFIGDHVRLARIDVLANTLEKAKIIADEHEIEIQALPNKFLLPFVEKASYEDVNSEMTDRWASLLVSGSENPDEAHPAFTDILSQIGPREAKLLRNIWISNKKKQVNQLETLWQIHAQKNDASAVHFLSFLGEPPKNSFLVHAETFQGEFPDYAGLKVENIKSIQILERQNLIKLIVTNNFDLEGKQSICIYAVLTPLGFDFTEACEKYVCKECANELRNA